MMNANRESKEADAPSFDELFSFENLRSTWKKVRSEAREHRVRDPVDFLDMAVKIQASLKRIQWKVKSGQYQPSEPARYEQGKSQGAFRTMTAPDLRDALIYRVICDAALEAASDKKVPGAFFSKRHEATPVGDLDEGGLPDPNTIIQYSDFWEIWIRYQEYRTQTLLEDPYHYLVVTDVSNYFESIPHELLFEYLAPLGLPRKAMGILGRLLEALKPSTAHSPNPRIGIPVDEFDCSRILAHIFLFEHDQRMAEEVGDASYVRWMDDQNIGVREETDARQLVNDATRSLSKQRLTLNSKKTRILSQEQVVDHFQLDANGILSEWEDEYFAAPAEQQAEARNAFESAWGEIEDLDSVGAGHWDKILKRAYGYAARVGSPILDDRALQDLIQFPDLDQRIFESLARRGAEEKLLNLFRNYLEDGECFFEATEGAFFDSLLFLDADPGTEEEIRDLALRFTRDQVEGQTEKPYGKAAAILSLYWFGANPETLRALFPREEARELPPLQARAWLAVVAARNLGDLKPLMDRLAANPHGDVARLSQFLRDLREGGIEQVGHYKKKKTRYPLPGKFYDARAWLQLELISQAGSEELEERAKNDFDTFTDEMRTRQEVRVQSRIEKKLELFN